MSKPSITQFPIKTILSFSLEVFADNNRCDTQITLELAKCDLYNKKNMTRFLILSVKHIYLLGLTKTQTSKIIVQNTYRSIESNGNLQSYL